jgi:XapX domain-containing protein
MKIYIVSLATGVLVGLIYALLQVRSPAPPAIALVGLLGMLIGEQALPVAKKLLGREPVTAAWLRSECVAQITGVPPKAAAPADPASGPTPSGQLPPDRGA